MLDKLIQLDQTVFLWVNNGCSNSFLDFLCLLIRKQEIWYPFYAIIVYLLYRKFGKEVWKILIAAGLMIVATDQFSANLVKSTFQRLRPCAEPALDGLVKHLTGSCNGFSFISAHATNHFALAVFIAFYFPKPKWVLPLLIFWAFSIAFSQVYVGVHYPLDVGVGALCGILFGLAISRYSGKFVKVP